MIDFHRVLLGSDDENDGDLTAEELRAIDLSGTRLLVLSICNGSVYRFGPGDEPYGLIPAALAAGAESVLGAQWPIEDRVGRRFMIRFYDHLVGHDPAEALRRASLESIAEEDLIRRWAAFVLVGPSRDIW